MKETGAATLLEFRERSGVSAGEGQKPSVGGGSVLLRDGVQQAEACALPVASPEPQGAAGTLAGWWFPATAWSPSSLFLKSPGPLG